MGQCYPTTYQNASFHRFVVEEMDHSLAARTQVVEEFRQAVRGFSLGDREDQVVFLQSILRLWSVIPTWSTGETVCNE